MSEQEFEALNREQRGVWEQNASFWDERMGEGNRYHNELVAPAQERLLDLTRDDLVLDIACGNGQFARRMAQLGARVVASDFSEGMIERARSRTTENADLIEYSVIDATDQGAMMALGERRFDAAVCTMALMDISSIEPLISSLGHLLKPGGRFVFSVTHPCFNSPRTPMLLEQEDRSGQMVAKHSIRVSEYIRPAATKGVAMLGLAPHYYFDRPISMLFNMCFGAGFALDGIEEPVFDPSKYAEKTYNWANPSAWWNQGELPLALVARMRLGELQK